jgi:ribose 5-phosphate isomerase A
MSNPQSPQQAQKLASAAKALELIDTRKVLGVGTGSTVNALLQVMAEKRHLPVAGVSSSQATSETLRKMGVEVLDLNSAGPIDLYVDGADECDPHFRLIKGGGAALTREKILAEAAREFLCLIDASKCVPILGRFPLPIEVIPMARSLVARAIVARDGRPLWREREAQGVVTDNGNWIIDVHDWQIVDPVKLEADLNQIPGVVCVGLFARRKADRVICAGEFLTVGL